MRLVGTAAKTAPSETFAEMLDRLRMPRSMKIAVALSRIDAADVALSPEDRVKVAAIIADATDPAARVPDTWDAVAQAEIDETREREVSCVYFIRHGQHIKIGVTRRTPERRLAGMQLPPGARVVAVIEGASRKVEQQLHKRFARSRVHGEWFASTPELEALIQSFAH